MTVNPAWRVGFCVAAVFLVTRSADAQPVGTVTLVSQERFLEARTVDRPRVDSDLSTDVGAFTGSSEVGGSSSFCLPAGAGCISLPYTKASGAQTSVITMTAAGALAIHGKGEAYAAQDAIGWINQTGVSRLTTEFVVDGAVDFALNATGGGRASIVLTSDTGIVFEHRHLTGLPATTIVAPTLTTSGPLPAGSYTLAIEAPAAGTDTALDRSEFDVRFTATPVAATYPYCSVRVPRVAYVSGDLIRTGTVNIRNRMPDPVYLELKIWLRVPDGRVIPAANAGADYSLGFGPGQHQAVEGVDLMTVDDTVQRGVWELGCRLLDPATGDLIFEGISMFEIR